ncbi:MAG: cell division protein FtsQ/DivIB [Nocardioidaceae bacterium]
MSSTVRAESRFSRRQWLRRLSGWRPWLIALGGVVVVSVIGWVVGFSTLLTAREVTVEGERQLSEGDVLAAASIESETPLLRVDLEEIDRRISALPTVADVSVHRSWPHTVSIAVTERKPLALISARGAWSAVDAEGVLFRQTPRRSDLPADVPVITMAPGANAEALREVAAVVGSLPTDLLGSVRRLSATSMDSISLSLAGEKLVLWGSAAESSRKAEVLEVLLAETKATTYNVSVPERPTSSTS